MSGKISTERAQSAPFDRHVNVVTIAPT